MPKEKIQSNSEARDLSMARQSLGRVKELDLSPEQKETVLTLIKQAKKLESEKKLHKALLIYNQVLDMMKKIKAEAKDFNAPGIKPEELWDWKIGEKPKVNLADYDEKYGKDEHGFPSFTRDGESFYIVASDKDNTFLFRNEEPLVEEDLNGIIFHAVSNDDLHFAVLAKRGSMSELITDTCKWTRRLDQVTEIKFSPDGKKLAVLENINDETILLENDEIEVTDDTIDITEFIYSPDSQKIACTGINNIDEDAPGPISYSLYDGEDYLGSFDGCSHLSYSPDGSKLAMIENNKLYINGFLQKTVPDSRLDNTPIFSPDGTKIAYIYSMGGGQSVAENDQAIWAQMFYRIDNIVYDNSGKNIAAIVQLAQGSRFKREIVINGTSKDIEMYDSCQQLTFSPDGKKVMFVGLKDGIYYRIVKDVSEYVK